MDEISVLIGGKTGFGIDTAGLIIASLFNKMRYNIYVYREYPSIIRGGHTFSIIRASKKKIKSHKNKVDYLLALNQDTINFHKDRLKETSKVIFDADSVKGEGIGLPITTIVKEEKLERLTRNAFLIGVLSKFLGIDWNVVKETFKNHIKDFEKNLKIALRGYDLVKVENKIKKLLSKKKPILTGNETISLGLIKAGLESYIAYPMSPSSSILHFMAKNRETFNLKVVHPESEIGVIMMALGFAYAGKKVAVGTSGGGFCLMNEGLSFSGIAELPVVIILCQRPGPATGLPTYTGQGDLQFALNAGHGEFARFIVAPGDIEEAYYWSAIALNLSWKYQIPSIVLSDKTLSEGVYSFDKSLIQNIKEEKIPLWDKKDIYQRYKITDNGVSSLAFVPTKDSPIKVNSYEHDESGITTESSPITKVMQEKRLKKLKFLEKELEGYKILNILGNSSAKTALLCFGSNKGVAEEVAKKMDLKVIQPLVLSPFPLKAINDAMKNVSKVIGIENNATGQLSSIFLQHGIVVHNKILKYDGRPFSVDELEEEVKRVIK